MLFLVWSAVVIGTIYLYFKQRYSLFARYGVKHYRPIPLLGNMARIVGKMDHFSDDIYRYYFDFPNERMLLLLIWGLVVTAAAYLYFRQLYSKFSRLGVKNLPTVPLMGNMTRLMLRKEHIADDFFKLYMAFPDERFVGRFEFTKSSLMVRDVDLVKQIAVKDFESFVDRRSLIDEKTDPLFGRNLFSLKGQEWKDMRSTLSPAFTSSKMKLMLPLIVEVGEQMNKALNTKIEESGGYIDVEAKDLTTRYANDVIASCAFGLKVNSHSDVDNVFYTMGKTTFNFNFRMMIMFFGYLAFPQIMKFFKITLFPDASKRFFRHLVISTMQDREERNIIRPDMIHLLMEAKKGKLSHELKEQKDIDAGFATVEESSLGKISVNRVWSQDDLIAQAVLFFLAGFETVSTTMSFLVHELALHPEVQQRLVEEIRENETKNRGKFDYNSISNMTYLDMVVSEAMRLWPPVIALDRVCIKDYNIGKPNKTATEDYTVRRGDAISIPVWGFHRDPQYFPDPLKFDPERFSEQNKHNINPFSYMPFGVGPRNCIGSRFALCEVKVLAYQLLQHMEITPCERTSVHSEMASGTFQLILKGGHWVRMKKRVSGV